MDVGEVVSSASNEKALVRDHANFPYTTPESLYQGRSSVTSDMRLEERLPYCIEFSATNRQCDAHLKKYCCSKNIHPHLILGPMRYFSGYLTK